MVITKRANRIRTEDGDRVSLARKRGATIPLDGFLGKLSLDPGLRAPEGRHVADESLERGPIVRQQLGVWPADGDIRVATDGHESVKNKCGSTAANLNR
jgi:hypothetical protein